MIRARLRHSKLTRYAILFVILVAVVATFAAIEPRYLSMANFSAVTRHMAANGLAALGLTLVVVVRRFDLSFPGTAAFAGMTIGMMIAAGHGLGLSIGAGLVVGAAVGAFNGVAVAYFELPDIITTIATGSIAAGCAFLYTGGRTIFNNFFTSGIIDMNDARVFGINISVYFLLAAYVIAWVILHRSRSGASFYATGENITAAYLSGIRTKLFTTLAFVVCGMTAVLAVVLILAESGTAETKSGATLLMPAYASVFLGAALLGRPTIPATLAGTLAITILLDGFSFLGVPFYYSDGVVSTILLVTVIVFDERLRGLVSLVDVFFRNPRIARRSAS